MEPVLGMAVVAAGIVGVFYVLFGLPAKSRALERERVHDLLKYGLDKGQPIPPELVREVMRKPNATTSRERDIRWGAVIFSLAFGLALSGGSLVGIWAAGFHDPPEIHNWQGRTWTEYDNGLRDFGITLMVLGILPSCVGFTFLMLGLTRKRESA